METAGGRILLYEDDRATREALRDALVSAGFAVREAEPPLPLADAASQGFDAALIAKGHLTRELRAALEGSLGPRTWIRLADPGERVPQDEHHCFVGTADRTRPERVVLTVQVALRAAGRARSATPP